MLAIVSPGDLAAAPPPAPVVDSARPIELELDTSVLEPDLGARLEQRLGEQLPSVLADAGLTLVDPGESHDSVLRARVMSFDADERNYQVELELRSADRTAGRRTIECEACSESRLLTLVLESTAELTASTELLEEHGAPARDTDSSADPADQALAPHVSPGRLGPFGRLGIAGLGLTGAGVTTCVVGVSLLIRKVAHDENSPSTVATTRELR
ncbi:MAG TPA: hypothetical protein VK034_17100, partial [Enhygromyxa sp.]|nr:hypothetical protein [Enhygromyxa sp.]